MRIKVALPFLVAGFILIFLPFLLRPHFSAANHSAPKKSTVAIGRSSARTERIKAVSDSPRIQNSSPARATDFISTTRMAATVAVAPEDSASRIDALENLDMGGSNALATITSCLNDSDAEVRKAAVDAAVQYGGPEVISPLQDALARADDPAEKAEIQNAIDFIKLPSVSENSSAGASR